jgi:hypothetical protein
VRLLLPRQLHAGHYRSLCIASVKPLHEKTQLHTYAALCWFMPCVEPALLDAVRTTVNQ